MSLIKVWANPNSHTTATELLYFVGRHTESDEKMIQKNFGSRYDREISSPKKIAQSTAVTLTVLAGLSVATLLLFDGFMSFLILGVIVMIACACMVISTRRARSNRETLQYLDNLNNKDQVSYCKIPNDSDRDICRVLGVKAMEGKCGDPKNELLIAMLSGDYGSSIQSQTEVVMDAYLPRLCEYVDILKTNTLDSAIHQQLDAEKQALTEAAAQEIYGIYQPVEAINQLKAEELLKSDSLSNILNHPFGA